MAKTRVRVDESSEVIVDAFCRYELGVRRLAAVSVTNSAYTVRQFLAWRAAAGRPPLCELGPVELGEFVVAEAARLNGDGERTNTMRTKVAVLRTFLRFLFAAGIVPRDLSQSVPKVAGARFEGLPKPLEATVVATLLESCDRSRPVGRRDFAILMLLARLGLRAVEVSRLLLEDIDWRGGELTVRGKRGRLDRMPLPFDVGEAVVDYLRFARPASPSRAVFLAARGQPPVGMSRHSVVQVTDSACRRANLTRFGGHRLRHTAATNLLRQGASLREVGEVLRQADLTTTAIYAKTDRATLVLAVRPWPGQVRP